MEIREFEKKRALNLIWNAAQDYDADPGFRVYDQDGRADLYWNCIIGSIYLHYDWEKLYAFYTTFHEKIEQGLYESLFWIAFENGAFLKEKDVRPVFPYLRKEYARKELKILKPGISGSRADWILEGHLRRTLGEDEGLPDLVDRKILDEIEIGPDLDTDQAIESIRATLSRYFNYVPPRPGKKPKREINPVTHPLLFYRRRKAKEDLGPVRRLAFGFGEHAREYSGAIVDQSHVNVSFAKYTAQTDEGLRTYITNYFGKPLFEENERKKLEKEYCTGHHRDCHLYFTRGDYTEEMLDQGFAGKQRRLAVEQEKKNEEAYEEESTRNRVTVERLTSRIRNSILMHLDEQSVHSTAGRIIPNRIWRALKTQDDRIFEKIIRGDSGNLSVDILLDASTSQIHRTEMVAAQGYMIAESLTRCGIPVRVYSFCSMNGYTIINLFRDYDETDKNRSIFRFFTTGANRDGLAVRIAHQMMKENHAEHRVLIMLTDCKPNDMIRIQYDSGQLKDYAGSDAVLDVAAEVRSARLEGISVLGVFYGEDKDLPAVRKIFDRDFVRIRSYDRFADSVGALIQNQIAAF